jgi:ubiquinone/menaquinone biosynthesis C-methylase UbiE
MPDHFQTIYATKAAQYEAMVAREDYQGNLLRALQEIHPLVGLDVVEFGAGTGRVTRLLAPHVTSIRAFDAAQSMLDVAASSLKSLGLNNWQVQVADNASLPVADASADLVIEGWSFAHQVGWNPDGWRESVGMFLAEMQRILRPGGTAILLETLGTGFETPTPPPHLVPLYQWWETEQGFSFRWIRTDYQFASVEEADQMTRFFFGDEMANRIRRDNLTILPECTGIWWRTF